MQLHHLPGFRFEQDEQRLWFGLGKDDPGPQWRAVKEEDIKLFQQWIQRYNLVKQEKTGKPNRPQLLELGREIFQWLDGSQGWMSRLCKQFTAPPLLVVFQVEHRPEGDALPFLEVPWEVLAGEKGFLASGGMYQFCPLRRVGPAGQAVDPSPYRLHTVFLAASPRGVEQLDFEKEETAILGAASGAGIDLLVEESGAPAHLADFLARETNGRGRQGDVLHISCHGAREKGSPARDPGGPMVLVLEDGEGRPRPVTAPELSETLGSHAPRLLFLSACMTSEPDLYFSTYAAHMVSAGLPSVLGWSGSVYDREATVFARELYRCLGRSQPLARAVAAARARMLDRGNEWFHPDLGSLNWHLARLYLGPAGGGVLSRGAGSPQRRDPEYGKKAFLDAGKQEVPVAGRYEFVGRRRELQTILREFRQPRHGGILLRGMGRQGKSSLAARAVQRSTRLRPVVVFKRYGPRDLLEALIRSAAGTEEIRKRVKPRLGEVEKDPDALAGLWKDLLLGPLAQHEKGIDGGGDRWPVLVILDDFERALEPRPGGLHRVKPRLAPSVAALLDAFALCLPETESRLMITCRFRFQLGRGDHDLAGGLLDLHLPAMVELEARKQAEALARNLNKDGAWDSSPREELFPRCIAAARGNPGLQDILFRLGLEAPDACGRALDQVEAFLQEGGEPEEERLRELASTLALDQLLGLLSSNEKELLRASTAFLLPVPREILAVMAEEMGLDSDKPVGRRLSALGLWEPFEAPVNPEAPAIGINRLVRPRAGELSEEESAEVAAITVGRLLELWGGEDSDKRPYTVDIELARLALAAKDADVLAVVGARAIRMTGAGGQFRYRDAVTLAEDVVACMDGAGRPVPLGLLKNAADAADMINQSPKTETYIRRALEGYEAGGDEPADSFGYASALLIHGRLLAGTGEPGEAQRVLERARALFKSGDYRRDEAITMGDIARILTDKGDVDTALAMHREELSIYESLGDRRSAAVCLGDIGKIHFQQDNEEEAVKFQTAKLKIVRELGDPNEQAIALWDLAEIELHRQNTANALPYLTQAYELFDKTGRLHGIAMVGLYLGPILCRDNQPKQGREMLQRSLEGFRKLGMEEHVKRTEEAIAEEEKKEGRKPATGRFY